MSKSRRRLYAGLASAAAVVLVSVYVVYCIYCYVTHPSGNVRKITIDPNDVLSIELVRTPRSGETRYYYESFGIDGMRITDPDIITACVNELNALWYVRYRGYRFRQRDPVFVITFRSDRPPLAYEIAFWTRAIVVQEGDTDTFCIEYQPVPVAQRLATYRDCVWHRHWLKDLAEMPEWNEESLADLRYEIRWYNIFCRHRPLEMPSSLSQLKEMLDGIPPLTLEELMRYRIVR